MSSFPCDNERRNRGQCANLDILASRSSKRNSPRLTNSPKPPSARSIMKSGTRASLSSVRNAPPPAAPKTANAHPSRHIDLAAARLCKPFASASSLIATALRVVHHSICSGRRVACKNCRHFACKEICKNLRKSSCIAIAKTLFVALCVGRNPTKIPS